MPAEFEERGAEAGPGPSEPPRAREALRALEERLARASSTAERLVTEAVRAAGEGPAGGGAARPGAAGEGPAGDGAARPGAAGEGPAGDGAPAQGWQSSRRGAENESTSAGELEALLGIVHRLRDLVPADLQQRVIEALRELLLALRALLDWYIERIERRRREPPPVRDIPIQ